MYLHELKIHKKIIGAIILITGIILMIISVVTGKLLVPVIKEIGLIQYLSENGPKATYIFTLFSAGFPIGSGISIVGAAILSDANRKRIWWYAWLLILAALIISLIPRIFGGDHSPGYFGIGGILIILLFLSFSWFWSRNRHKLDTKSQIAADLKMAGYFFFLLAGWELCGLGGIPFLVLYPEKLLEFNTLPFAVAQTKLIMALFIIAWIFTAIGYLYNNQISLLRRKKEREEGK